MGPSAFWSEGSGWGCSAEAGDACSPRRPASRPEEFPTEVEGHSSALDLERVLLHFSNVGSMKLKTVFSNTFPASFLSHSVCAEKGTTCAFDSFTLKSSPFLP